jgi:hypothetical protein
MRRIWVALLVLVLSFALIGPGALAARADWKLPLCCRSNGKHHCASAQKDSSGPAFQFGRCPSFGGDQTVPPLTTAAMAKPSPAVFGAVLSHPALRPQTKALLRIAFDHSGQKRGPPILS